MKLFRLSLCVSLLGALVLGSCVKKTFDAPPDTSRYDPNTPVNLTIAQLNHIALSLPSGQFRQMGDSTIYGIVVADDRSGNFYKQIVIEDSTGGITVDVAQTNLYTDYPVGRKIYVKLGGLVISNYNGCPIVALSGAIALGKLTLTGIPTSLIPTYIVKASYPNEVAPILIRLDDLIQNPTPYFNRLVTIENMEFDSTAIGVQYALPSLLAISTSRLVHPCPNPNNSSMVMYNSGFANFQPVMTPSGKGNLTGIFSIYNSFQFLIRDTSDVQFTAARDCR